MSKEASDATILETEITKEEYTEDDEDFTEICLTAQIEKLKTRIEHMKYNIDQNIKRGEELSGKCYNLLRSTELLTFELVFAEYLLADGSADDVFKFLKSCVRPKFNFSINKQEGLENAVEHVRFLQKTITKSKNAILHTELHVNDIPKRTTEFVMYLNSERALLEKETIGPKHQKDGSEQNEKEELEKEEEEIHLEDFKAILSNWLETKLDVGNSTSEDTIELRCLIHEISDRLANISKLYEEIALLKGASDLVSKPSYADCAPQTIENSPFFIGVQQSSVFLMSALTSIKTQRDALPAFQTSLNKCHDYIAGIARRTEETSQNIKRQFDKLLEATDKKNQEAQKLFEDLKPFITAANGDLQIAPLPESEAFYTDFQAKLRRNLDSGKASAAVEENTRLQLDLLERLLKEREGIASLCDEQARLVRRVHERERALFEQLVTSKTALEIEALDKDDLKIIKIYAASLEDTLRAMELPNTAAWRDELQSVGRTFRELAQAQREIEGELSEFLQPREPLTIEEEKRSKPSELSEKNHEWALKLAAARHEHLEAEIDRATAREALDALALSTPLVIDRHDKESIKHFKEMALCPVCHTHARDLAIKKCGHVVCSECLKTPEKKCPVCAEPFEDGDLRPFFL